MLQGTVGTIDAMPISAIFIIALGVVLLAIELGFRTGRWRLQTGAGMAESEAQLSAMTGSLLALLAFIMAFSFSMAAGHYHERRALILEEANAISTAHLRATLIDTAEGAAIADQLADYTAVRVNVRSLEEAPQMIAQSEQLQDQIWAQLQLLIRRESVTVVHSLLIQSLNDVFDVHEQRVAAGLKHRVPRSLWFILASLLVISMLSIGYFSGSKGSRNPIASTLLALAFSLVLFLIADLDRPTGGIVRADLSPLLNLQLKLESQR
jgi:hypothetical protein